MPLNVQFDGDDKIDELFVSDDVTLADKKAIKIASATENHLRCCILPATFGGLVLGEIRRPRKRKQILRGILRGGELKRS